MGGAWRIGQNNPVSGQDPKGQELMGRALTGGGNALVADESLGKRAGHLDLTCKTEH